LASFSSRVHFLWVFRFSTIYPSCNYFPCYFGTCRQDNGVGGKEDEVIRNWRVWIVRFASQDRGEIRLERGGNMGENSPGQTDHLLLFVLLLANPDILSAPSKAPFGLTALSLASSFVLLFC
jgi:hypothetical protein